MSKRVQFIRYTATASDTFVGKVGEVTVDLTNGTLRVHDGFTPGGKTLAVEDLGNVPTSVISAFMRTVLNRTSGQAVIDTLDPALGSIAGLTTVADRLLYTTAADTYDTAVITAFGRSLCAAVDDVATRALLNLGSMALQDSDAVEVSGAPPAFKLTNTSLAADNKSYRWVVEGGQLKLQLISDDGLTTTDVFALTRTDMEADTVHWNVAMHSIRDITATLDNKLWRTQLTATAMQHGVVSDDESTFSEYLRVNRQGTTVTEVRHSSQSAVWSLSADFDVTAGGDITFDGANIDLNAPSVQINGYDAAVYFPPAAGYMPGATVHMRNSPHASTLNLVMPKNIWRSFGPSASFGSVDEIWPELDSLPSNTKFIRLLVIARSLRSSATSADFKLYKSDFSTTEALDASTTIIDETAYSSGTGTFGVDTSRVVDIPVNTSNRFKLAVDYSELGTPVLLTLSAHLIGYGV